MDKHSRSDPAYRRDLGGGLVLRWSSPDDVDGLVELYRFVFRDKAEDPPNQRVAAWTRDLMSGKHPLIGPGDFALVEDPERDVIVAATCLMQQTWDYGGIAIPVGRPEIVASMPDYRNHGLIRAIFELIHARSDTRGNLAMGITGINYYYRQFGYEYALDLAGSRTVPFSAIQPLKEGGAEPYSLHEATPADLPLLLRLYERDRSRCTISTHIDAEYWRYTLDGHSPESGEGWRTHLIQNDAGRALGYVLTRRMTWRDALGVIGLVVDEGVSLVAVMPSVLRALRVHAEQVPQWRADGPRPTNLQFVLGRTHPVYQALGDHLAHRQHPPYAWYVRVPDLPRFIRQIAPVLEQRLAQSVAANHTGELKLDFYRGGLRLAFEDGRLTAAEDWRRPIWNNDARAGFPPLVFLQLLFGHRSIDELRHAFPDVWVSDDAMPIVAALFPPQPSWVLNLD